MRLRWRAAAAPLLTLALAAALVATALHARGGLQLGPVTTVTIALDLVCGLLCAAAILLAPSTVKPWGVATIALLAALAALTGMSISWAISPDAAWIETNGTIAWLLVFSSGAALVRLAPDRWRSMLSAVLIASVAISLYALMTKVFPVALAEEETYARLREPFGYWNAVGLAAAIGIPISVWLGARRDGHAALAALAYPALGVLILTMLMAYSRGAIVASAIGLAFWFACTPLRLRGAAVLIPSALFGLLASIWAFGQSGLSDDAVELTLRSNAGTELGVLLLMLVLSLVLVGLAATWVRDRRTWPEPTRRAWGIALLVALALTPVALAGTLALSERGLGGSVSKAWSDLTDPEANTPANDPSRLTAIGSVRARYWRDAIDIFEARTARGVGAGGYATARLRFRSDDLDVLHAHGYLIQTAADLGLAGLALSLALLAAWLAAAGRATGPWRRNGPRPVSPERAGLLTMVAVVVTFGAHSLIDWTRYVPGNIVPVLLLAGWIAARGPLTEPLPRLGRVRPQLARGVREPVRAIAAVAALTLAVTAAWSTGRPQDALDRVDDSLAALADRRPDAARELAREAGELNPLALEPLFALAEVEGSTGNAAAALAAYQRAVQLQPANVEAWVRLANFDLQNGDNAGAMRAVEPALYLDPRSPAARAVYLEAYKRTTAAAAKAKAKKKKKKKKK